MARNGYDFSGWATKYDVKCSDGRTIRKNAFKHNDGKKVSIVWQHRHDDPEDVLGYGYIEHKDEGEYFYGYLNNSRKGQAAKEDIKHGDIFSLSIFAGNVQEKSGNVFHGDIKEVSLVISPANPEAHIDIPFVEHEDDAELEAFIDFGEMCEITAFSNDEHNSTYELSHSNVMPSADKTPEDIYNSLSKVQKDLFTFLIAAAVEGGDFMHGDVVDGDISHSDEADSSSVKAVFNSLTDEQKNLLYTLLGFSVENEIEQSDIYEEDDTLKHNVFENETEARGNYISHDDMAAVFKDAKRLGSLKASMEYNLTEGVFAHSVYNDDETEQKYGTANIDYLFPEYKNLNNPPEFIKRDDDWVSTFLNGVHRTPFSRVRSLFADITMEEARAKGYLKNHEKKEEVFTLLRRKTDPQTVYKKQKADRDDILDITDFSYVAFLRGEMRGMLDEEIARAALIGDGRSTADPDKISEDHIRPVLTDDTNLFLIRKVVNPEATEAATIKKLMEAFIRARKNYKGSGNLTLFTTEDFLSDMLLLEDGIGHRLYKSEAEIATALRVRKIVTNPLMENLKRAGNDVIGIALDLRDYSIGADKGGAVSTFEDFDIDYNQYKYLIETRCSGALIKPFSAIVVEKSASAAASDPETDPDTTP